MVDSDRRTDERGSQNLIEKEEERKKKLYRKMVVFLKWNMNNIISIYMLF